MKSTGLIFKPRYYIGSAEPPATVLEDGSRFGNHGTFKADGEPDWVQLSSGIWVMSFDGNDYINCGTPPILDITGDFSIVAWIYPTTVAGGGRRIFNHGADINDGYELRQEGDDVELMTFQSGQRQKSEAADKLSADTWYHIITTRSGNDGLIYLNAVDETTSSEAHADPTPNPTRPAIVGAYTTAGLYGFVGQMTPPWICSYVLSAGRGKQIFEAERHWFGV